MSHPDSAGTEPERPSGDAPTEPPTDAAAASEPPVPPAATGQPTAGQPSAGQPTAESPASQPEYLMAMEAPDPTPTAPSQPGAPPASYPVPGAPAPRRGRMALVLVSIVAGLAVVASGVLATLLVVTAADLGDTRDRLAAVEAELAEERTDHQQSVDRLESDLQRSQDDLAAAEQELDGAENMVDLLRSEQSVIRQCVALNNEVVDAIITGDEAAFNAVIDEAEEVCEEADEILGS